MRSVSDGNVVLCRWSSEAQKFSVINWVCKGNWRAGSERIWGKIPNLTMPLSLNERIIRLSCLLLSDKLFSICLY